MSDARNDLLLAALQRSGKPLDSEDLLNVATEYALEWLWEPVQLALNRQSVAARLRNLEREGKVSQQGVGADVRARRPTPLYVPTAGWDPSATIPPPPDKPVAALAPMAPRAAPYLEMTRPQLLAVLEAQDILLEATARLAGDLLRSLESFGTVREKARQRLLAAGIEA